MRHRTAWLGSATVLLLALGACTVPQRGAPLVPPSDDASATTEAAPSPATPLDLVAVPDVRKRSLAAAGLTLQHSELRYEIVSVPTKTVPDGQVVDVTPQPGRLVRRGSTITVQEAVTLVPAPSLTGKSLGDAEMAVRAAGLVPISLAMANDDVARANKIAAQEPPRGTQMRSGTHVTLRYYGTPGAGETPPPTAQSPVAPPTLEPGPSPEPTPSTGTPEPAAAPTEAPASPAPSSGTPSLDAAVPLVAGLTEEMAAARLRAASLSYEVVTAERADVPDGTVLGVTPSTNARIAKGSAVTLRIGVTTVTVPDARGQAINVAESQLAKLGLVPEDEQTNPQTRTVYAQEPAPGSTMRHGGHVTLLYGQTYTASPVPTPSRSVRATPTPSTMDPSPTRTARPYQSARPGRPAPPEPAEPVQPLPEQPLPQVPQQPVQPVPEQPLEPVQPQPDTQQPVVPVPVEPVPEAPLEPDSGQQPAPGGGGPPQQPNWGGGSGN